MKKVMLSAMVAILAVVLVACGGTTTGEDAKTTGSKSLVIYTNSNSDGRGEWWEEQAKAAGFDITIVGAGGADATNRLISEKTNPTADLVFGLNSMLYEQLKAEEVLDKYIPVWSSEVEAGTSDPDGYYHSIVKQALLLVYSDTKFDATSAPTDYSDLWTNSAFHGKYEVPTQLAQITPRIILSSILVRHQDPNGELGISAKGWEELSAFLKNGVPAVEGEDFYTNLAAGKVDIGTAVSGTLKAKQEQHKVTVGIVAPEIGTPTIIEQIALVKGSKNTETAKEFIDWFGSAEVQGAFSAKFNSMPTNKKAAEEASEEVKALYSKITTQDLDWGYISDHIDEWMEKVELELL